MNYQELLHSPLFPSRIASLVQKASQSHAAVLIEGERGTEKELVAKVIHHIGKWSYGRFCELDCRMLTEDAFLDQLSRLLSEVKDGTNPATLYLKNVEYLRRESQLRLLELIEDGMFENGSEKKAIKNVRTISSSSESLEEKVAQGTFSEDLRERLNILLIQIAPLRDRLQEIPTLARYILTKQSEKMKTKKVEISPEVLKLLQNYWWPGNVRELEHVILRCAIFSEGENLTEKDLSFETEDGANGFASFLKRTESASPSISKGDHFLREEKALLWSLFLIELVHRIKNPLVSIKTFTQLLREKFDDVEFRDYFYRVVTEDIGKVDLVLNSLLNYVRVNSPLDKTNTVHDLLEGVLKENEIEIEKKKIKIFRKFEKDLPETTFHDEQLRYIFKSILQYIVSFLPLAGSIGFLTKSSEIQKSLEKSLPREKDEKCIEILIVYTGYRKPVEHFEAVLGISSVQKREPIELELRLVKEIIERNRGVMTFQVNEKKPRTLISLILPMERRKIVSYESTNS